MPAVQASVSAACNDPWVLRRCQPSSGFNDQTLSSFRRGALRRSPGDEKDLPGNRCDILPPTPTPRRVVLPESYRPLRVTLSAEPAAVVRADCRRGSNPHRTLRRTSTFPLWQRTS
jgi:hypothetical protein